MPKKIFSVVIPAYNCVGFITKTLDCLKNQTFRDFEAIIVDDGSGDGTYPVVSDYIASNPQIEWKLFRQQNKGIAAARNKGVTEAKSPLIAFLDHDDIWYPEKLKNCHEVFKKYPEVDLVCHDELMRDTSTVTTRHLSYGPYVTEMFRKLLFKGNCVSTSAAAVRRNVLLEAGLFREGQEFSTVEDYDLWLRLAKKYKFFFLKEILGEYIVNDLNASLNSEKHYNNLITALRSNFGGYAGKKFGDHCLINLRIARINCVLTRHFIKDANIKKALKYLSRALLSLAP